MTPQKRRGRTGVEQKAHGKLTYRNISTAMLLVMIKTVEYAFDKLFYHCTDYAVTWKEVYWGRETLQNILGLQLSEQICISNTEIDAA